MFGIVNVAVTCAATGASARVHLRVNVLAMRPPRLGLIQTTIRYPLLATTVWSGPGPTLPSLAQQPTAMPSAATQAIGTTSKKAGRDFVPGFCAESAASNFGPFESADEAAREERTLGPMVTGATEEREFDRPPEHAELPNLAQSSPTSGLRPVERGMMVS
jgi:hypothetical protein